MKLARISQITTSITAAAMLHAATLGLLAAQPMSPAPVQDPAPYPTPASAPDPAAYPPTYPVGVAPYPGPTSGPPSTMAPVPLQPPAPLKSESTALWYALGGTLAAPLLFAVIGGTSNDNLIIPGAVVGVGLMLVGPSSGHFYAEGRFKVTTGMGIRVIGTAVGLGAGLALASTENCDHVADHPYDNCGLGAFALTMLVVGGSLGVGTIWDLATAGQAARNVNERAARVSWHAAPLVMPSYNGRGTVTGLAVGGSF